MATMAIFPRRFLPSMSQLCAFEAAARHQSFTRAATELSLTQSAVSRQIQALEDLLGIDLFVRTRQTVKLSSAGAAYAQEVRSALHHISQTTLGVRANPHGGTLMLAILPTFGTRWLAPRLPRFLASNPGITINLSTRLSPFDFQTDQVDAAIHFGLPDWPGANFDFLRGETVVPACSPHLHRSHRFNKPAELLNAPLLHVATRDAAWTRWFREAGVECDAAPGMVVDQFAVAAQAAINGLGVALLPTFLITDELAKGDLVIPINLPMKNRENYYLAWPRARENHPPLMAFREWIKREVEQEAGTCPLK